MLLFKISNSGNLKVYPIYNIFKIDSTLKLRDVLMSSNIQYVLSSSLYKDEEKFDLFC